MDRHWPQHLSHFAFSLLLVAAGLLALAASSAIAVEPSRSVEMPAYAFDRGNAKTFTDSWANAEPMIGFGGESPVMAEYDLVLPVAATYTIGFKYAAANARPVELYLDQTHLGQACRETTESWNTSAAKWETAKQLWLAPGKHTIRIQRGGDFPHIVAVRLESSEAFPPGWKLERPKARTLMSRPTVPASQWNHPAGVNLAALRLAITDLMTTGGAAYPNGAEYLKRLDALEAAIDNAKRESPEFAQAQEAFVALRREALLANPVLNFDKLLVVKRGVKSPSLGLPNNWESNSSLPHSGFDDSIEILSPVSPDCEFKTLYRPEGGKFVGDVDLNFDGRKLLFSMVGSHNRWQVFEIGSDGAGLRQITGEQPDVDSYDACYLPSGKILFTSTACFTGVPCVWGGSHVTNTYLMDADGKNIRQLTVDQEHNWCPTVLNNGRVLYSRWEYIDTPHSNTRLLFQMNPDGTGQMQYYKSNSYWPNSIFYARPVPNHPTKVVGVIGGHHDNPRMGELVVFDPAQGRREAEGAVQKIPGYGKKVEPIIADGLTRNSWPKFLHPYPLSEKYFLVSMKPDRQSPWGLYLVDVFDNMLLLKQMDGYALLEPVPLRATPTPPVIPEKVDLASTQATVYLSDVYAGDGLKGIPRGTVKSLRIISYNFAYQGMGGLLGVVGMDGPWDVRRVVGTVPVSDDGSAKFHIPANVPVALQPLDGEGKALQIMRSWMTAMPGEVVQCSGCHESQNSAPPARSGAALAQPPSEIKSWYGPMRGFSYQREVQPVIDKYCVGCHDGQPRADGKLAADLRGSAKMTDYRSDIAGNGGDKGGKFSVGYAELHRYVRRPGIESDYQMLTPMEFHADTTELMQLLKRGHYNVKLDQEAWDRLVMWIDLNTPYHGNWSEGIANPGRQRQRRSELLKLYANVDDDPETLSELPAPIGFVTPERPTETKQGAIECPNWPFDAAEAQRRQQAAGAATRQTIDLGEGLTLELALIPAGEFVIGSLEGEADQRPIARAKIEKPFWMGTLEVSNRQFARFDPLHDSRFEDKNGYQFGVRGYPANRPEQPVVRVSWQAAMDFCRWLSAKTGRNFSLPTEAQWEYACRAGAASPMFFGNLDSDFSPFANMADAKLREFAIDPYSLTTPLRNPSKYDDWIPRDARFNDGAVLAVEPGRYRANPWGLKDMHGNVSEWTRTAYLPYPYSATDGRNDPAGNAMRVVRGGSWRDRPAHCTSSVRWSYQPYQKVFNVGFRVMCEAD